MKRHLPAIILFVILMLGPYYQAFAKEPKQIYLGLDRYGCQGMRSECRPVEARERAREAERRYYDERLQQERERARRER